MPTESKKQEVEKLGHRIDSWCAATNTSKSKAYADMKSGKLPFVIIGGRRFIPNSVIESLLQPDTS